MPVWIKWAVGSLGFLFAFVVAAFPFIAQQKELIKPLFVKDPFAMANLDTQVSWSGFEWLVGFFIFGFVLVSLILFNQKRFQTAIKVLFAGSGLMVIFILWAFIGRIESFSQGTAIDFFKSIVEEDSYVLPYNYKSYAPYFYARVQPHNKPGLIDKNDLGKSMNQWRDSLLLSNNTSKNVYIITKVNRKEGLENYPELDLVFEKNGWSVFKRGKKN